MNRLVDFDYIAIFDADFKPEPDFLVGARHMHLKSKQALIIPHAVMVF
jgi:cellulose synthase/poly-beta-1,6-N-acetylglucosamine synthase-like glycosyltransferase